MKKRERNAFFRKTRSEPSDWIFFIIVLVIVAFPLLWLFTDHRFPTNAVCLRTPAILLDVVVFAQILMAALRKPAYIWNRVPALVIVPVIFAALIVTFAAIFVATSSIQKETLVHAKDIPVVVNADMSVPSDAGTKATNASVVLMEVSSEILTDPWEAVYFSLATITTYGSDFGPVTPTGRRDIMFEIGSGLLFLLMAFPVLASRLALFDETRTMEKTTKLRIRKKDGGDWEITRIDTTVRTKEGTDKEEVIEVDLTDGKLEIDVPPQTPAPSDPLGNH